MVFTTRARRIVTAGGAAVAALALGAASALAVANIGPGSSNVTGVKCVQRAMNLLDGAGLAVDGSYGSLTTSAVRSFQSTHSDSVDGVVGPQTGASIRSAMNADIIALHHAGDPATAETTWVNQCAAQLP